MHRTIIILLMVWTIGSTAASAEEMLPKTGAEAAPKESITLAVTPWPGSAAIYVASEQGYFEAEGLDVTLLSRESGHLGLNAVLNGKADLGTAGETPIALAGLKNLDIAVVATIVKTNRAIRIVARKDKGISGPEDLRGKTVGVVAGTTAQVFLYAYLTTSYIDSDKVRVMHIAPNRLEKMLISGEVDAVSTWAPHSERLKEKLGENAVVLQDPGIYTMTWNIVSRKSFLSEHPERVGKFLRALIRANRFLAASTPQAREIVSARVSPSEPLPEAEWEGFTFTAELDQSLILNLEEQARWMITTGLAKGDGPPNYLEVIDASCLKAVQPERVNITGK